MTSRGVTLAGYALIALVAIALEVVSRRSRRLATLGDVVACGLRRWPCRVLLQAGWLWLGWHLFVRTHWQ
jgi:hypothetical protein